MVQNLFKEILMFREAAKTEIKRIDMVKINQHIKRIIDSRELNLINISNLQTFIEDQMGNMVIELSQGIAALPNREIYVDERWPETWWDAFKERWFPTWALKRWPIKYKTLFIKEKVFKAICPHLGVHPSKEHLEWVLTVQKGNEKD